MLPRDLTVYYAAARRKAQTGHASRRADAFAAIPRLEQIEHERRDEAFSLGIRLMEAADADEVKRQVKEKLDALEAEQNRLLADNGLPIDYLTIKYECEKCSDTGLLPDGTLCPCAREKLLSRKYASSGLAPDARFELFSTAIYKDQEQRRRSIRAKELCELYAGEFALAGARGLIIMGGTGVGKTFLLDCIGRRALERGKSVQKYTAYNIIDMMLRAMRNRSEGVDLTSPELLIIDDLGTEPMIPSVTVEALFAAINERGNAGIATAVATNLTRGEILDIYGERIFSRLFSQKQFSVIELRGQDLRL